MEPPEPGPASAQRAPCSPTDPFLRFHPLPELSTRRGEAASRLTPDELTIYLSFTAEPIPGAKRPFHIAVASRSSTSEPFGTLTLLNLPVGTSGPSINADGKLLYYTDEEEETGPDLFVAPAPFLAESAVPLTALNTTQWEYVPYLSVSGETLYYARRPSQVSRIPVDPTLRGIDLYMARKVNGTFSSPTPLDELNTDQEERNPVVSADDLRLYFGSDRAGSYDIYVASRARVDEPFGPAVPLSELNGPQADVPNWISEDECRLYVSTNRDDPDGSDIWLASRR